MTTSDLVKKIKLIGELSQEKSVKALCDSLVEYYESKKQIGFKKWALATKKYTFKNKTSMIM